MLVKSFGDILKNNLFISLMKVALGLVPPQYLFFCSIHRFVILVKSSKNLTGLLTMIDGMFGLL